MTTNTQRSQCCNMVSQWIVAVILGLSSLSFVRAYTIAPITDGMRVASSQIISYLLPTNGVNEESSEGWKRLAYICDTYGPRFSGSQALEDAFDYIRDLAVADNLRVTEQWTTVPKWVRGEEVAYMVSPRRRKLNLVGLGMSNSTLGKVRCTFLSACSLFINAYTNRS